MKWFRLYTDVVHDPKVQCLHPALFKHWINILCIVNGNTERGIVPVVEHVAYTLRVKPCEAENILSKLEDAGLLERSESGQLFPHNWTLRQRATDDVATRVARYRNNKLKDSSVLQDDVTLPKRSVDTDTDTDKKKRKELSASGDAAHGNEVWISRKKRHLDGKRLETFKTFWTAFDYQKGRAEAIDSWLDIPSLTLTLVNQIVAAAKAEARARPGLVAEGRAPKMAQGWLTARRWEDEAGPGPPQGVSTEVSPEMSEAIKRARERYARDGEEITTAEP